MTIVIINIAAATASACTVKYLKSIIILIIISIIIKNTIALQVTYSIYSHGQKYRHSW